MMATHNDQDQTSGYPERPLSRSAYREQQRREQEAFDKRDRERLRAEKRYAKQHGETNVDVQAQQAVVDEKVNRLKRRLNIAIAGFSVGIVIVFLILFFVEF